jgi:phosphoglycolate phosphatase-like HAD superfamily hydrolase
MRIAFDVDGTLLQSVVIDAELYAQAFVETFGVALPTSDWSRYRNATDRGIAEEAVALIGGDATRIVELRARFVTLLAAVPRVEPTPGASALLQRLRGRGVAIAIATGGWQAAAREKLRAGDVDVSGVPLVGSDEYATREEILRAALLLAGGDGAAFYVGDGAWDARASAFVGAEFIAVGEAARGLSRRWVPDLADAAAFDRALAAT